MSHLAVVEWKIVCFVALLSIIAVFEFFNTKQMIQILCPSKDESKK